MDKQDKEIHDAIQAKFGTSKTGDEIFTDKTYWATVPVGEDGEPHEIPRSNPDVLPESAGRWFSEPTEAQETQLDAIATAGFTEQERAVVELSATGLTLEEVGRRLGLTKDGAYSALKRARKKVFEKLGTQNTSCEQ